MKQKIRNFRLKMAALWWFVTRKNYYLLAYNDREGKSLESYNVIIPEFLEWVKMKHGYATNKEMAESIARLSPYLNETGKNIATNIINKLNYE